MMSAIIWKSRGGRGKNKALQPVTAMKGLWIECVDRGIKSGFQKTERRFIVRFLGDCPV
jgi:hypothetical protein